MFGDPIFDSLDLRIYFEIYRNASYNVYYQAYLSDVVKFYL